MYSPYQNFGFQQSPFNQNLYQPMPQINGISGRVVNDPNEINVNDVSVNNNFSVFPRRDMSSIYVKSWNQDGTIKSTEYRPFVVEPNNSSLNEEKSFLGAYKSLTDLCENNFKLLNERLDRIESRKVGRNESKTTRNDDVKE